jgi:hypothetical protein
VLVVFLLDGMQYFFYSLEIFRLVREFLLKAL